MVARGFAQAEGSVWKGNNKGRSFVMRIRLVTSSLLFSLASLCMEVQAASRREYTCAYVMKQPGLNINYFAATSIYPSSARWEAKNTCEYNKGRPFGPEFCDSHPITCTSRRPH